MIRSSWFLPGVFLPVLLLGCGGSSSVSSPSQLCTALGCSSWPQIQNPTGSCSAPDDGSRPGYHYPMESQWIPDCQNPLNREYWRVFVDANGRVSISPRVSSDINAPFPSPFQPVCQDPDHDLAPLVQAYALCSPTLSAEDLALQEQMSVTEALLLTHFLHQELYFEVSRYDLSTEEVFEAITPRPIPSDILDACDLYPDQNSPELSLICEWEREQVERADNGYPSSLIGYNYGGPEGIELAHRLNQLYGIAPDPSVLSE